MRHGYVHHWLIMLLFVPFSLSSDKPFIKKRSPSLSTLREECCGQAAHVLEQIPAVLREYAQLQQEVLALLRDGIEGSKEGKILSSSKTEVQECNDHLTEILALSKAHCQELKRLCHLIKTK